MWKNHHTTWVHAYFDYEKVNRDQSAMKKSTHRQTCILAHSARHTDGNAIQHKND